MSEVANVPRTRVYDAAAELRERGLVGVVASDPRRYCAVSTESTRRRFQREYEQHLTALTRALETLDAANAPVKQRDVWTVTGCDAVTERVIEFVAAATDEVVLSSPQPLFTGALLDHLSRASDRGVSVRLAGLPPSADERLDRDAADARPFEPLWERSELPAGRLLLVDRESVLVSGLAAADGRPPAAGDETGVWATGPSNALVVVLKALLTRHLDGARE